MHESDTSGHPDEGSAKGLKGLILRLGTKRFGPPDEEVKVRLEGITDLDRLRGLCDAIFDDTTRWADLFPRS